MCIQLKGGWGVCFDLVAAPRDVRIFPDPSGML